MEEFLYFQRFDAKGLADFDDSIELHTGNSACQACSQGTVGNICGNGKLPQMPAAAGRIKLRMQKVRYLLVKVQMK